MTEPEGIKNIREQITLVGLLPDANLDCLPPEESAKLKCAVLDLYRLSHADGFKAGTDYAMNEIASAIPLLRNALQIQWLKRWLLAQMRECWWEFKTSLRSIRPTVQKPAAPPLSD